MASSLTGFGQNNQTVPTRLDQILKDQADQIANAPKNILGALINQRNQAFNAFWQQGPEGITPIHRAKALGPRAIGVFTDDAKLVEFITQRLLEAGLTESRITELLPSIPARYTIEWQQDGSVVLTDNDLANL